MRGCSGGIRGCPEYFLCQKRLMLSWEVDESKPLVNGGDTVISIRQRAGAHTRSHFSST